jgi:hypothetical protein
MLRLSLPRRPVDLRPGVVEDGDQMIQQYLGLLLKVPHPLQAELVNPVLQVPQHRTFVAVRPEAIHALFQQICFQLSANRSFRSCRLAGITGLPSALAEPTLAFHQPAHPPTAPHLIASLACCMMWNFS